MNAQQKADECHIKHNKGIYSKTFPTCRRIYSRRLLKTYVTKGEIAQNKQYRYLPLFSVIILSFLEIFLVFARLFSKSSAADLLYVGKG